jgi:hypothetical protein
MRLKTHFAKPFNQITLSSPPRKNILLSFYQKLCFLAPSRLIEEGRFAIVTDVEAGSDGRCNVRRACAQTTDTVADGQAVWS